MPCREEMPSLERLHRAMGGQGLRVVAISLDPPDIDDDSIARFAKNLALTFEVVRDTSPAIWQTYQLTGVPETFVLDTNGVIRRKYIGKLDWNSQGNRALIANLLGVPFTPVLADSNRPDAERSHPLVPRR